MAIEASKIRRWLDEEEYEPTPANQPNAVFSFQAKTRNGLQFTIWQPKTGPGKVLITAAIGISDEERAKLAPRAETLLWTVRYGLLQVGVGFDIQEEAGLPKVIALVTPVWEDGLSKATFMGELQRVINGMVLVIVSVRHVMTTALILGTASSSDEALSKMLAQLRPHAMMLVISSADEYIKDMLTALRA